MVHPHIEKVLFPEDAIDERVRDIGKRIAEDFEGKRPVVLGVLKGCFMFFSDVCKRIDPLPEGCEAQFARASSYVGKTTSTGDDVEVKLTFVGGGEDLVKDRHVIVVSPPPTPPARVRFPNDSAATNFSLSLSRRARVSPPSQVEDIVDTGKTMLRMLKSLERLGAKTVTVATLLDKPTGRKLPMGGLSIDEHVELLPSMVDGSDATAPELGLVLQKYIRYTGFECPDGFVVGYGMDYDESYRTLPYVGILKEEMYSGPADLDLSTRNLNLSSR